jgi:hypothetical protein
MDSVLGVAVCHSLQGARVASSTEERIKIATATIQLLQNGFCAGLLNGVLERGV